jgi:hypothetical protein
MVPPVSVLRGLRLAAVVLLVLLALPALGAAQEPAPTPAPAPAPAPAPEPQADPAPAPAAELAQVAPPAPLGLTVSAAGAFDLEETLDWAVAATVVPGADTAPIAPGETRTVAVRVDAHRAPAASAAFTGVRGEVCVDVPASGAPGGAGLGLKVQAASVTGSFVDLPGATQTILPTLAPGQRACNPYEIAFPPALTGTYRVVAGIVVAGQPAGEAIAPFALPAAEPTRVDEAAHLAVAVTCPPGLVCAPAGAPPEALSGPGSFEVAIQVRNEGAACDSPQSVGLAATLTETDSGTAHEAAAAATLLTADCAAGVALPVGHWQTHAGATPPTPDRVSPFLPVLLGSPGGEQTVEVATAGQALPLLAYADDRANGVNRLYAQLLAAKLNVARGTPADAAAGAIAAADAWLAEHGPGDWLLSPDQAAVTGWTDQLEAFNAGGGGGMTTAAAPATTEAPTPPAESPLEALLF